MVSHEDAADSFENEKENQNAAKFNQRINQGSLVECVTILGHEVELKHRLKNDVRLLCKRVVQLNKILAREVERVILLDLAVGIDFLLVELMNLVLHISQEALVQRHSMGPELIAGLNGIWLNGAILKLLVLEILSESQDHGTIELLRHILISVVRELTGQL
jgi:hypothetical protein